MRSAAGCRESLDLYADVLLNPTFPDEGARAPARPDARHHPAGEGAARGHRSTACCPRCCLAKATRIRRPRRAPATKRRSRASPARSSRRSTSAGCVPTIRCCWSSVTPRSRRSSRCSSSASAPGARRPRRSRRRTSPTWRSPRSRACSSSIGPAPSSRRSWPPPWRRRAPIRTTSASSRSTPCSAATSRRGST